MSAPDPDLVDLVVEPTPRGGPRGPPVVLAGIREPADFSERLLRWFWRGLDRELMRQYVEAMGKPAYDALMAEVSRRVVELSAAQAEAARPAVGRVLKVKDQQETAMASGRTKAAAKKHLLADRRHSRHNKAVERLHHSGKGASGIYNVLKRRAAASAEEPGAKPSAAKDFPSRRWVEDYVKKLDRSGS